MSESGNKERINCILQASRTRGLAEPDPGVDQSGDFTLTWLACVTEIIVSFTPAIYVTVLYPDAMLNRILTIRYGCAVKTDSEVIDLVEQEIAKGSSQFHNIL